MESYKRKQRIYAHLRQVEIELIKYAEEVKLENENKIQEAIGKDTWAKNTLNRQIRNIKKEIAQKMIADEISPKDISRYLDISRATVFNYTKLN